VCPPGSPGRCAKIMRDVYPWPCVAGDPYWEACGQQICVPGGTGYHDAGANRSNYPHPAWQIWKGGCCVECRMRACCDTLAMADLIGWLVRKFRRCERLPSTVPVSASSGGE